MTNTTITTTTTTAPTTAIEEKAFAAINGVTGKAYFGDRAKRLQEEARYRSYSSNVWATMKQWNSVKQTIAKGEKGTLVLFYEPAGEGAEPQAKRVFLFNRCQLENFKATDCGDKTF